MEIRFTVHGNHEDRKGNPVPYRKSRSRFEDRTRRYVKWKQYVLGKFLDFVVDEDSELDPKVVRSAQLTVLDKKAPLSSRGGKVEVNCMVYFRDDRRGDPENIRKGILDALFHNDKNIVGYSDFDFDEEKPRVEIEILDEREVLLANAS